MNNLADKALSLAAWGLFGVIIVSSVLYGPSPGGNALIVILPLLGTLLWQ